MIRKIFNLFYKHTAVFYVALYALIIPIAIFEWFAVVYAFIFVSLWLIVQTGFLKGWDNDTDGKEQT